MGIAANDEFKSGGYEVVVPPVSVLAEFPVAIVDKVVDAKGTRKEAEAYLKFQYTSEVQSLLTDVQHAGARPGGRQGRRLEVSAGAADRPYGRARILGQIQSTHFASNGVLDQLLAVKR